MNEDVELWEPIVERNVTKIEQRHAANVRERRRMRTMNAAFEGRSSR